MKRFVIVITATRCYSRVLALQLNRYFDGFEKSVLSKYPDAHVLVIHGGQTGGDEAADALALVKGWKTLPLPYHEELGADGGRQRNRLIVQVLKALVDYGGYDPHCWAFPDDRSVGTRDCVKQLEAANFQVWVEELGPRRAEFP